MNLFCYSGLFDFYFNPGSRINRSKGRTVLKAHDTYCYNVPERIVLINTP